MTTSSPAPTMPPCSAVSHRGSGQWRYVSDYPDAYRRYSPVTSPTSKGTYTGRQPPPRPLFHGRSLVQHAIQSGIYPYHGFYRQLCTYADGNSVVPCLHGYRCNVYSACIVSLTSTVRLSTLSSVPTQTGYDSQKDVYNSFFEELDHAIEVLGTYVDQNPGKTYMARYDNVYPGDVARLVKFAILCVCVWLCASAM